LHSEVKQYVNSHKIDRIVLSDQVVNWATAATLEGYAAGFGQYIGSLQVPHSRMYLLGSPPQLPDISQCANRDFTNLNRCSKSVTSFAILINAQVALAESNKLNYIMAVNWLCYQDICPAVISNTVVTAKSGHLNQKIGALLSSPLYAAVANI
jgi:hypothetical protein